VLNPFVFSGFSLHDELGLLVEAGLTRREALRAATLGRAVSRRERPAARSNPARTRTSCCSKAITRRTSATPADLRLVNQGPSLVDRRVKKSFRGELDALRAQAEKSSSALPASNGL
jgi:hypothetical protein